MPCAQGETAPLDKTERAGLLLDQRGSCVCTWREEGGEMRYQCAPRRKCVEEVKDGEAAGKRGHMGYQHLLYSSQFFFPSSYISLSGFSSVALLSVV